MGGEGAYPRRVGERKTCASAEQERRGACTCDAGWGGGDCSEARCGEDSTAGASAAGTAAAAAGAAGEGCVHGKCLAPPYCTCEEGYSGRRCELAVCAVQCEHGRCLNPEFCSCAAGWFGAACDAACVNGRFSTAAQNCTCEAGWVGTACDTATCPLGCVHGRGFHSFTFPLCLRHFRPLN